MKSLPILSTVPIFCIFLFGKTAIAWMIIAAVIVYILVCVWQNYKRGEYERHHEQEDDLKAN